MKTTFFVDIDQTISTGHVGRDLAESIQYYRDLGLSILDGLQSWPALFQMISADLGGGWGSCLCVGSACVVDWSPSIVSLLFPCSSLCAWLIVDSVRSGRE